MTPEHKKQVKGDLKLGAVVLSIVIPVVVITISAVYYFVGQ